MKQESTFGAGRSSLFPRSVQTFGKRLVAPIIFFLIAFTIDMATNQQYSSVWGSAAIIASVVYLFPTIRPTLAAIGAYAGVWIGFNLVRAVADDAGLALAGLNAIADLERRLFGGTLPSDLAQERFFDPSTIRLHDVVLSMVHGSFFIIPFSVAGLLLWKHRPLFRPYTVATGITFALGLIGFLLLPTAPPWMAEPQEVARVTHHVLPATLDVAVGSGTDDSLASGFRFEPNHYAAMPSVHVAATALVYLVLRQMGRVAGMLGATYAFLMSIGVIYLGEHYVIDAVSGWAIAIVGWILMLRFREMWST